MKTAPWGYRDNGERRLRWGIPEVQKLLAVVKNQKYIFKTGDETKEKGKIILQMAFHRTKGYAVVKGDKEQETAGMRRGVTVSFRWPGA